MELLSPIVGDTVARIMILAAVLLVIAALVLLVVGLALKVFRGRGLGFGGSRNRAPRLSIPDIMPIDSRRKLILVRRDAVEHLLLVGGATDLVVEQAIQRNVQPARPRPVVTREQSASPPMRTPPTQPPPRVPRPSTPTAAQSHRESAPPTQRQTPPQAATAQPPADNEPITAPEDVAMPPMSIGAAAAPIPVVVAGPRPTAPQATRRAPAQPVTPPTNGPAAEAARPRMVPAERNGDGRSDPAASPQTAAAPVPANRDRPVGRPAPPEAGAREAAIGPRASAPVPNLAAGNGALAESPGGARPQAAGAPAEMSDEERAARAGREKEMARLLGEIFGRS